MNKMAARAKIEKKSLNDSSPYIIGPVWIKLDRHIAFVSTLIW